MPGTRALGHAPDSTLPPARFGSAQTGAGTASRLRRVVVRAFEQVPNALEQLRRDIATTALGADDLLELTLEVRMAGAGTAAPEMLLDLQAHVTHELTIQVELDLLQHVFALSR